LVPRAKSRRFPVPDDNKSNRESSTSGRERDDQGRFESESDAKRGGSSTSGRERERDDQGRFESESESGGSSKKK